MTLNLFLSIEVAHWIQLEEKNSGQLRLSSLWFKCKGISDMKEYPAMYYVIKCQLLKWQFLQIIEE